MLTACETWIWHPTTDIQSTCCTGRWRARSCLILRVIQNRPCGFITVGPSVPWVHPCSGPSVQLIAREYHIGGCFVCCWVTRVPEEEVDPPPCQGEVNSLIIIDGEYFEVLIKLSVQSVGVRPRLSPRLFDSSLTGWFLVTFFPCANHMAIHWFIHSFFFFTSHLGKRPHPTAGRVVQPWRSEIPMDSFLEGWARQLEHLIFILLCLFDDQSYPLLASNIYICMSIYLSPSTFDLIDRRINLTVRVKTSLQNLPTAVKLCRKKGPTVGTTR